MQRVAIAFVLMISQSLSQPGDSGAPLLAGSTGQDLRCIEAEEIYAYRILTDTVIEMTLRRKPAPAGAETGTGTPGTTSADTRVILALEAPCPQLAFHGYVHYVPVDGLLCADRDQVQTRSGEICPIIDITAPASVIRRDGDTGLPGRRETGERTGPR